MTDKVIIEYSNKLTWARNSKFKHKRFPNKYKTKVLGNIQIKIKTADSHLKFNGFYKTNHEIMKCKMFNYLSCVRASHRRTLSGGEEANRPDVHDGFPVLAPEKYTTVVKVGDDRFVTRWPRSVEYMGVGDSPVDAVLKHVVV